MTDRTVRVRVEALMSDFNAGMASGSAAASAFARNLEESDNRLSNVVQTALALAPALVPISALGVPALAGLTTQLGFLGLGAGVTALAFDGVGNSLKALNDYQLEPSAENLAKLQTAFDEIGPAGQEFVFALDRMEPALERLQALSAAGVLPGATEGLEEILTLLPQVEGVVMTVGTTIGDMLAEGGEQLAGPKFEDFFDYLQVTARPILTDLLRTVGNLGEGVANSLMAFDPLSRDFSSWLLDASRDFADATANLEGSDDFQEFLDYLETNGPAAGEALGAVGTAIVDIIEAAAPVGAVVLPVIEAFADGISALADSSFGPIIIGTAAAVGVLGRSLALLQAVGLRGGQGGALGSVLGVDKMKAAVPAMQSVTAATMELAAAERRRADIGAKARDTQFGLVPTADKRAAVREYAAANRDVALAAGRVAEAEKAKADAFRQGAGAVAKTAAATAGLVVATSGVADGMGLTNTASFALLGTLAGPWGAAIGGSIGLAKDFADSNDDLQAAMSAVNREASASAINFAAQKAQVAELAAAQKEAQAGLSKPDEGFFFNPLKNLSFTQTFRDMREAFTGEAEAAGKTVDKQLSALERLRTGAAQVYADLNNGSRDMFGATDAELTDFTNRITPALQRAGISVREFLSSADGSNVRTEGLQAITRYFNEMESASGKSRAVGDALGDIGNAAGSAVDPVDALAGSLEDLFGTELDQQAAADAYLQTIADLGKQMRKTNGDLSAQTEAGRENRASMRGAAEAILAKVNADAAAGASGAKLARTLVDGREAMIQTGISAGRTRGQMERYVATLGLAPKNIETIITASGVLTATQKVRALSKLYGTTPRELRTMIRQFGADPTMAKVRQLAARYNLTPKQVLTLLRANDLASAKAKNAKRAIDAVKDKSVSIRAKEEASAKAAAARAALNAIDGKTAQTYITTFRATVFSSRNAGMSANPGGQADGGFHERGVQTYADGGYTSTGMYVPRVPQIRRGGNVMWSEGELPWEAYISGKPSMRDRNLEVLRLAGEKLGATVSYARGGFRDEVTPARLVTGGGGSGGVTVVERRVTGPVVLEVGGQKFDAYLRDTAREEASAEVDAADGLRGLNTRAGRGRA